MEEKLNYFIERTQQDFAHLNIRVDKILEDNEVMKKFRWQVLTGIVIFNVVVMYVIEIIKR